MFTFEGLYTKMRFVSTNVILALILALSFSKIVGCEISFDQKLNNTNLLRMKMENADIFQCAASCVNDESCQNGWIYYEGNNNVSGFLV